MPTITVPTCDCSGSACSCGAWKHYLPDPRDRLGKHPPEQNCRKPHPSNDGPVAFYMDRRKKMHSTEIPGGMFCQKIRGHKGRCMCWRDWDSIPWMGEMHEWGADLNRGKYDNSSSREGEKP